MKKLSLVAIVKAKKGEEEFVKSEILKLIPITRAEKGCMNYNLFEDNKDETRFLLQENWETHADWQAHMDNTHMAAYSKATEKAVETWELIELSQID